MKKTKPVKRVILFYKDNLEKLKNEAQNGADKHIHRGEYTSLLNEIVEKKYQESLKKK